MKSWAICLLEVVGAVACFWLEWSMREFSWSSRIKRKLTYLYYNDPVLLGVMERE
jgi:hypothetical protein